MTASDVLPVHPKYLLNGQRRLSLSFLYLAHFHTPPVHFSPATHSPVAALDIYGSTGELALVFFSGEVSLTETAQRRGLGRINTRLVRSVILLQGSFF